MPIDGAFTTFPVLTTQRLRLRQMRPDDAEAIFATTRDEEVARFMGHGMHRTIEETRTYIQRQLTLYAERRAVLWCITLGNDDWAIGTCGLHHFDEGYHCAETSYELNRSYWGQGIMADAVSAILTFAFAQMGLHRVEAVIEIANERSKHLLLKLGFQYEGNLRQRYVSPNGFVDEYFYGLLRDEWHLGSQDVDVG